VLVSSHLLAQVEQTVDDVVIIANGRLVHASSLDQLRTMAVPRTIVVPADPAALANLGQRMGWQLTGEIPGAAVVQGVDSTVVGHAAFQAGLELHQLVPLRADLEQLFFSMTQTRPEGGAQ
jgi:ABC-2 type transport system ATP-binding protein